ncbi:MAG: response regulator, partial [Prevotellaceae bacterium]|nr:response regulator [Prevotellaceae bacterium]
MNVTILWIDDEVDLLKSHIIFLEAKGYTVHTASNGQDGVSMIEKGGYDLVFLDENMPGMNGFDTLKRIKELRPMLPVVMITKSEEEDIMHKAIGAHIADYLVKPVNPNQVLLSIKKVVHHRQIVSEQSTANYRVEFGEISSLLASAKNMEDWVNIYRKLVGWEINLQQSSDASVREILSYQMNEANNAFCKFISQNYLRWFDQKTPQNEKPLMSHQLMRSKVFPHVKDNEKVAFLLIDNLRFDHWRVLAPTISQLFKIESDELYCSILPTATQYARNAIFSGLMPSEIEKVSPDFWLNDEEEGGKNQFEEEFLRRQMQRLGVASDFCFKKIVGHDTGKQMLSEISKLDTCSFAVIVYNFVDVISHARTSSEIVRELADDESAYRSLTRSWFEHSDLLELLKELAERKFKVIISTDHGTVRVNNPVKIVGDRNTSTNLRYKTGKALAYDA